MISELLDGLTGTFFPPSLADACVVHVECWNEALSADVRFLATMRTQLANYVVTAVIDSVALRSTANANACAEMMVSAILGAAHTKAAELVGSALPWSQPCPTRAA